MKAVKGNKEYIIKESQLKAYRDMGFDIRDDEGTVIAYGRGKTVPYEEHKRVLKEADHLRARAEASEADNEALKEELEALRAVKEAEPRKSKATKAGE